MTIRIAHPARRRARVAFVSLCLLFAFSSSPAGSEAGRSAASRGTDPWTLDAELTAPDGAANDFLGRSVAIDGDTVVVGAAGSDVDGSESQGAAYVFVRSGDEWLQQAKLTAADGVAGDEFGFAVAISGDTIVVGARFVSTDGIDGRGAAYVFLRNGTSWDEQARLVADDAAAFDELGFSVNVDGDVAAVGAPFANGSQGKVYVFTRADAAWSAGDMIAADDGAASDRFGLSIGLGADTIAIGAPSADVAANADQGAVYVYARSADSWELQQKVSGTDSAAFDEFGASVALDGDTMLVGAHYANVDFNQNQGAAYVFERTDTSWSETSKLLGDDSSFTDEFGFSVALRGDTAIVGALFANPNGNENQGEAYAYSRSGSDWTQVARLVSDGAAGDEFGIGAAVDGTTAVVGAESAAVDGEWAGAAYVFSSAPVVQDVIFVDGFDGS